jgi:hypothetical protein
MTTPTQQWTGTGSILVKPGTSSSPLATEVPFGPGHLRTRLRHVGGPTVFTRTDDGTRGKLVEGEVLELDTATVFTTEVGTGTAVLRVEKATRS